MEIYDLKEKQEFLYEVMELELTEWGSFDDVNKADKIKKKIDKYLKYVDDIDFCKLILVDNNNLIGFISMFPYDGNDEFYPWYATMFVKKEYRGLGYSKVLNDAILEVAKKRGFKELYLKTELINYYEKFGAKFVSNLNEKERILKFELN